jgi:predicted Zn-dependent protease
MVGSAFVKIPARITIPALIALVLALGVGGLFLWQIHRSVATIESSFGTGGPGGTLIRKLMPGGTRQYPDSATQSTALMQLRQGEIYELKGEWKQAQTRYEESVASGGGAPALKKLAAIQLQRREFDAAADTIGELKNEGDDSDDVLLLEGILAIRQGRPDKATEIFGRKPDSPQAMYGLGLAAIAMGDHERAKADLSRASGSGDPVIRAYGNAILQAYADFALFPQGQIIHLQTLLARALAQVNECETALKLVIPVVTVQPRYRDAWIVKGFCEFNTERTKDAMASLEQAYSLDPEKPEIQYFLARTHAALGDPQNAVTFLQYSILNGFQPERDARELLADYALELGNTALALEQLKLIAEAPDSDLVAYRRYIDLAAGTSAHSLDALAAAKNALVRWPDDAAALTLAAKAALSAGLPADATKYIDSALRIDPTDKDALTVQDAIKKAGSTK